MSEATRSAEAYRRALVERLKQKEGLLDPMLEAAFLAVPRHVFLPEETLEKAYSDEAIGIKRDTDGTLLSSSSQPSMMALMLRQLRLRKGDNVLEIGSGTGYNAAIMQQIIGENGSVTSVELDHELAQRASLNLQKVSLGAVITIVNADGAMGYAPRASYDRIIATVAVWDIPLAWPRQLKTNGILVAPIWLESMQASAAFVVQEDGSLYSHTNIPCGFIALRGMAAGPVMQQRISSSALIISAHHVSRIDSASVQSLLSYDAETNHLGMPLTDSELWRDFVPYLTLNTPEGYQFIQYSVGENQQAFGLEGNGFALTSRGSACFVPYNGQGAANCYAGADAFIAMQDSLRAWDNAGRPGSGRLRLRLVAKGSNETIPAKPNTKVYSRQYHDVHVWLDV